MKGAGGGALSLCGKTSHLGKVSSHAAIPSVSSLENGVAMWGFVRILHLLRVGCLVTTDYTSGLFSPSLPVPRFASLRADRNPFSIWGFLSI
jgi:hypothetical protein